MRSVSVRETVWIKLKQHSEATGIPMAKLIDAATRDIIAKR